MRSVDVAIVGGGVVGCAIAREFSRYRLRVLVLERAAEVGFGTSKANSGIIHAGHHSASTTLKGRLEWEGNQRWAGLADALGFGFRRIGELTVAFDDDDRRTLRRLLEQGEGKGVPGLELWPAERVRREEPNLSGEIEEALHAPTAAVVNPYEACFALAESAVRNGVELACGEPVKAIDRDPDGWFLLTPERTVRSRFVINAAGLHAVLDDEDFLIGPTRARGFVNVAGRRPEVPHPGGDGTVPGWLPHVALSVSAVGGHGHAGPALTKRGGGSWVACERNDRVATEAGHD